MGILKQSINTTSETIEGHVRGDSSASVLVCGKAIVHLENLNTQ